MFKKLKEYFSSMAKSKPKVKELKPDPLAHLIPDDYPSIDLNEKCLAEAMLSYDELEIIRAVEEGRKEPEKKLEIPREMTEDEEDDELAKLLNSELEKVTKSKNKVKNYG
jgi:protein subunit release factor A